MWGLGRAVVKQAAPLRTFALLKVSENHAGLWILCFKVRVCVCACPGERHSLRCILAHWGSVDQGPEQGQSRAPVHWAGQPDGRGAAPRFAHDLEQRVPARWHLCLPCQVASVTAQWLPRGLWTCVSSAPICMLGRAPEGWPGAGGSGFLSHQRSAS